MLIGMDGDRLAHRGTVAVDEIEDARRHAGGVDDLGEQHRAERRDLAGFQDDRAAGCERRRDFGGDLVVEAARPWALAFTRQYHWPIAIAVLDRSSVVVRFSTIPDSPVSPFHGTLNMQLSLLGRALGRAYLAFCPVSERSMLLDMLARSQEAEDKLATERKRALVLLATIRKQGFAERDPMVEPRSSNTIALPVIVNRRVLVTVGMTYFTSALDRSDVVGRYVPLVKALAVAGVEARQMNAAEPTANTRKRRVLRRAQ
ncbi:hypothetical protein CQ13_11570 [Bradyrhizobium retamae]|uniref:IclR-ED domain-containing protein n=1 Tax=Bradyrhizobium retamae TaxID=1300035 RepID=A0A0R3MKP6_9BRAD|nr:hypothetical protein CQ13_11570 [Bradyrhizobium retamae]